MNVGFGAISFNGSDFDTTITESERERGRAIEFKVGQLSPKRKDTEVEAKELFECSDEAKDIWKAIASL